jgi:hypothetical protein
VKKLSKEEKVINISKKSIDMLLKSTFKRHGVKIDNPPQLSKKVEIRNLVKDLTDSVNALTKKEKK